ncbi:MAG: cyclic nucleotide-binding domain-containing protein, partial [Nitrospirota bacterium]
MASEQPPQFDPKIFRSKVGHGKSLLLTSKPQLIISQGDAADAVFYIQTGQVKLTVPSEQGKEAIIAILEPGNFFGDGCLAGQLMHMAAATAVKKSTLVRIDKQAMPVCSTTNPASPSCSSRIFYHATSHPSGLSGSPFNASEKRLARILL